MYRNIKFMLIGLLSLIFITACGSSNSSSNEGSGEGASGATEAQYKIAYLTPGLDVPFWKYLADGIEAKAKDANFSVQVYDSRNDSATQLQNAQDAITKQVDVLIISPTDSASAPSVLKIAEEAGIPVVIADIGTDSGEYESLIVSENEEGANEVGTYLADFKKDNNMNGSVGQVTISLARKNGQLRTKGFEDAVTDGGFELSDLRQLEKYTRAEAEGFAQDLITAFPDMDAIFGQADEPTLGVLKAVEGANKQDDVLVVGFDATPETIDAVREGRILAVSVQQPVLMGEISFDTAQKILNGEEVEKEVLIPTILVTKDNIDEVQDELNRTVFPN